MGVIPTCMRQKPTGPRQPKGFWLCKNFSMANNPDIWKKWEEKELKAERNKKRTYFHFDPYIKFSHHKENLKKFLSDEQNIASHSFYPFIKTTIRTPRYKGKNKGTEIKERELAYAAHFDSFVYSWLSTQLDDLYENALSLNQIDDSVTAYRALGKNNIHFAKEVFEDIISRNKCVALTFDISSFFDNIDHQHLKKEWCKLLDSQKLPEDHYKLFKNLTNYSFVDRDDLFAEFPINPKKDKVKNKRICNPKDFRERVRRKGLIKRNANKNSIEEGSRYSVQCGIPQGSPVSAVLSNIYLFSFDEEIQNEALSRSALYRRYSDDLIIVCKEEDVAHFEGLVTQEIKKYELQIQPDKTDKVIFEKRGANIIGLQENGVERKHLQYLGFEFDGTRTLIRSSSFSRYKRKMKAGIRKVLKEGYSKKRLGTKPFKRKMFLRYSEKGKRNFISYAQRASKIMNSNSIFKQQKDSMKKLANTFNQKQLLRKNKKIK